VVKVSSKREFEFRIKYRKTKAIFEIENSDEAVAPTVLPNIFESFFTTKPLRIGTDLGLSVSDNIIKNLDYSIEYKSKGSGKGTLSGLFYHQKIAVFEGCISFTLQNHLWSS
jgi:C4-dicarboxylate-specific signal transduction histidine kinase